MKEKKSPQIITSLKPFDVILFVVGFGICATSFMTAAAKKQGSPLLLVTSPTAEYVYPLDRDDIIHIQGLEGVTEIKIQQGQASYTDSPCANKTCMAAPPVHRNGDWSACLPNGIFMRVEASQPNSAQDIDIMAF